jgi:hypothetical protein
VREILSRISCQDFHCVDPKIHADYSLIRSCRLSSIRLRTRFLGGAAVVVPDIVVRTVERGHMAASSCGIGGLLRPALGQEIGRDGNTQTAEVRHGTQAAIHRRA